MEEIPYRFPPQKLLDPCVKVLRCWGRKFLCSKGRALQPSIR